MTLSFYGKYRIVYGGNVYRSRFFIFLFGFIMLILCAHLFLILILTFVALIIYNSI